jgi:hypothetical protein
MFPTCRAFFSTHTCTDGSGNATTVTYYDWKSRANLIQITDDKNESAVLWDLELDSGHSYYFTPTASTCFRLEMPVGILRPDWLMQNATCLGERMVLGRKAVGWTKVDFIDYWADAEDLSPLSWYFHSMKARFDTVYFQPGAHVPSPSYFAPPSYCANQSRGGERGGEPWKSAGVRDRSSGGQGGGSPAEQLHLAARRGSWMAPWRQ